MSISFRGNIPTPQSYITPEKQSSNASDKSKTATAAALGTLAAGGIATAIVTKGKSSQKVVEAISKKLPELETKAKSLWGKLTGSTKKAAEEARKLEESRKLEEARVAAEKRAEENKKRLEEIYKAQKEEEAARKREHEEFLKKVAQRKAQAITTENENKIIESVNGLYDPKQKDKDMYKRFLDDGIITRDKYMQEINKVESRKLSLYERNQVLETKDPSEVFSQIIPQLERCKDNGGTNTVDDVIHLLERIKTKIDAQKKYFTDEHLAEVKRFENSGEKSLLEHANSLKQHFAKDIVPLENHSSYVDELLVELKSAGNTDEAGSAVLKKAIGTVDNNRKIAKEAAIEARKATYTAIKEKYQEQIKQIRERISYDENYVPNSSCELTPEQQKATAEELSEIIKSGGSPGISSDSSLGGMMIAWKNKYISIPFNMKNKEGETAILNGFPRYEAGKMKNLYNDEYYMLNTGDFKYEPVYRQMHVENLEEFVRQFDEIGGVYAPGMKQSCAKTKYYGEAWGPFEARRYGFAEWNPGYNVRFVIHPKGPITNAAEIGEGKYGNYEVLYAADSKFKILGKVKKTVTKEEMLENFSKDFKNDFDDFEKYEIHLQEM